MFNSMTEDGYRGERPNEFSGSWFPPKCLSGQQFETRKKRYGGLYISVKRGNSQMT
jgi:hypothetical protein